MKKTAISLIVFLLLFSAASFFAVSAEETTQNLRKEIVKVKYIKANQAFSLLSSYLTLGKGHIRFDDNLGLLTITDIPEVVDKMLSVLKEIDVKPVDLEFTVDIYWASMSQESEKTGAKTAAVDAVLKEVKALLKYKSFELIDSSFARVQENKRLELTMGGKGLSLELRMNPRYIKEEKSDLIQVDLRLTQIKLAEKREVNLIETSLSQKSGDKTVVGVSKLDGGDDALILVVSGKVVKF